MEKEKKPFYRYCMVPMCPNTIKSTPDKVFFAVPRDPNIRKQWCKVMRRDNVSPISRQHCCEDHFNIKEDTVNYIKYKLMKEQGEKVKLLLNKGVMPHKFQCQKRNVSSPQERMYAVKKRRLSLMNKALSEPEDNINRELKFVDDEVVFETNIMKCETEMVSESGKYDLFGGEIVTHNLEEKCYIDKIKSESVLDVYYEPISEKCIEKISEGPQNKFLEIQVKKELESVEDEVVFETDIKCETEMVSESGKYDMFGIEMVTHNLKEKYDIDQIKSEGVIDVYNEPISENCIGKISEGSQNKFLEIQVKRELESVKDEVVFETDMKCETEMVSESGKCDMFGIEMVTHNLEEKYDIDQIRSEGVIDVYLEPKSEKCIEEISEGPQNKFFEIQDSGNVFVKIEDETVIEKKEESFNEKESSALCQKEFGTANDHILKPYQCKICSKSFISKSYLKIHEKIHTGEKSFQCKICLKSFVERGNLKAHNKMHTGEKPFQCKICLKSFIRNSNLKAHERTHSGEKPYQCKICLKLFTHSGSLKTHDRIHTGKKSFQCKICLKSFTQSISLKRHERTHSAKKPFPCKICSKSFFQTTHLKSHERIHTGEKLFQCKICLKSFTKSGNLKSHERTHTGKKPFQCKICLNSFVQSAHLKSHERTHTGEKPFQCKTCLKSFNQSGNLKTHEKTHS